MRLRWALRTLKPLCLQTSRRRASKRTVQLKAELVQLEHVVGLKRRELVADEAEQVTNEAEVARLVALHAADSK